jgi:hypothetical protein
LFAYLLIWREIFTPQGLLTLVGVRLMLILKHSDVNCISKAAILPAQNDPPGTHMRESAPSLLKCRDNQLL